MTGPDGDTWVAVGPDPLAVGPVADWAVRADCGAVVVFSGTVRDSAEGRSGVTALHYEAWVEQAEARLAALAEEARRRWPALGRLALLHRTGTLAVGDCSVLVVASTPHRPEAFDAARWCIDTLKATLPVWKRETWAGGEGWGTGATPIEEVGPHR